MKTTLTFLLLFPLATSFSQDASIIHYQKKWNTSTIQLPEEKFNSRYFRIPIPDSIYSAGSTRIKKVKLNSIILKNYSFSFENDTLTKVEFLVSDKHLINLSNIVPTEISQTILNKKTKTNTEINGKRYLCLISRARRKIKIEFFKL